MSNGVKSVISVLNSTNVSLQLRTGRSAKSNAARHGADCCRGILAADVVGYSRLVAADEAIALALFKAHRKGSRTRYEGQGCD